MYTGPPYTGWALIPWKTLVSRLREAAGVVLGVVQLDPVVGQFAQLIVVDVDGRAGGTLESVDGVGDAPHPVVADHMALARNLDAPGVLDALSARPGAGASDSVVGQIEI
ncbi:MAG: hypothetical protein FJY95_04055 [Candidatus Handelsmanbacteria bacterium]|nr:hypothetical protein [Candidatus Handelsmanbacteria bacterium]